MNKEQVKEIGGYILDPEEQKLYDGDETPKRKEQGSIPKKEQ